MKNYFVAREKVNNVNAYTVFTKLDFDADGYYEGYRNDKGYHINDLDIVAEFDSFEEACDWVDEHIN